MIALFLRAWLQVSLISLNVTLIAQRDVVGVAVTSFLIGTAWWWNTKTAAHARGAMAMIVYCTGSALGAVSGMWLGYR